MKWGNLTSLAIVHDMFEACTYFEESEENELETGNCIETEPVKGLNELRRE